MSESVKVDENVMSLLHQYCKIRTTTPEILLGRIARTWYSSAVKEWSKNPKLIPSIPSIPASRSQTVSMNSDIAKIFIKVVDMLNTKHNINMDSIALLSWLAKMFIKTYNMKYLTKKYKERMGKIKRML